MRKLALCLALATAGCTSNVYVRAPDGGAPGVVAGQSRSGGWTEVISPSSTLAALLFGIGIFAIAADDVPLAPAYPMDPRRNVNEQDCTQPVDLAAGNLRCR